MLKQRWQAWANKRFQCAGQKQLSQRDILIFIYQQGYIYVVLILITFIAGINYANNLVLGFSFLISAILCISFYLTFKQLHQVKIEVIAPEVGQVGNALNLIFRLQQDTPQTRYIYLKINDTVHQVLMTEQRQQYQIEFFPQARGKFSYPEVHIYSIYPLGLVRAWTYLYLNHVSWVAPRALNLSHEKKQQQSSLNQDFDEFRELREYQIGDAWQSVSWKQVARGQGLYVKRFEQHADQLKISIDYHHMPSYSHEQKLGLMMGLVEECEHAQMPYEMILPKQHLGFGLGEQQYKKAQRFLAEA